MTTIEWTQPPGYKGETWNPTVGCSKVSPGCDNCYAIDVAHRAMQPAHEGLTIRREGERPDWTGEVRHLPADGHRTTVVFLEPDLTLRRRAIADGIVDRLLDRLQALGLSHDDAAAFVLCELVERHADAEAYERESQRRGVLAL